MTTTRIAVTYARVSDEDKQDASHSLRALRVFCEGRSWPIHSEYSDEVTGDPARRNGDPPGLRAALEAVAALRGHGVLVVTAVDRLVRSTLGLIQLINRIQSLPGFVTSMEDGGDCDTTTDNGELQLFLRGWFSRMELRFIRKRTRLALDDRREQIKRKGGFTSRTGVWRTRLGRPSLPAATVDSIAQQWRKGVSAFKAAKVLGRPESTVRNTYKRLEAAKAFNPYPRKTPKPDQGRK